MAHIGRAIQVEELQKLQAVFFSAAFPTNQLQFIVPTSFFPEFYLSCSLCCAQGYMMWPDHQHAKGTGDELQSLVPRGVLWLAATLFHPRQIRNRAVFGGLCISTSCSALPLGKLKRGGPLHKDQAGSRRDTRVSTLATGMLPLLRPLDFGLGGFLEQLAAGASAWLEECAGHNHQKSRRYLREFLYIIYLQSLPSDKMNHCWRCHITIPLQMSTVNLVW